MWLILFWYLLLKQGDWIESGKDSFLTDLVLAAALFGTIAAIVWAIVVSG